MVLNIAHPPQPGQGREVGHAPEKAHHKTGEGRGASRDESGLSFHPLPHTAVTWPTEVRVPHAVVQEPIDHDSPEMSGHYPHVGAEALQTAANTLPDVMARWITS